MIAGIVDLRISKTLVLSIFFLCFIAAYFETLAWMMPRWFLYQGFYSHSPLLVVLVGHLLWRVRHKSIASHLATSRLSLVALFIASLSWLVSWAADLMILQIVAVYLILILGFCNIAGKRSYRTIFPAFGLLIFALPIWQPIQIILQNVSTYAVQSALNFMAIPVYVDGNMINIPNGIFKIEGGCSGLGFLLVSLSLTGYLMILDKVNYSKLFRFMIASAAVALLANWIRILLIVLVGYFGGMDQALVNDHVGFGWVVYSLIFFPYLYLVSKHIPAAEKSCSYLTPKPGTIGVGPALFVLFLSLVFPAASVMIDQSVERFPVNNYSLPLHAGAFVKQKSTSSWQPLFPSANYTELAKYSGEETDPLHVFVAGYAIQKQGSEIIHLQNRLYNKEDKLLDRSILETGNTNVPTVTELILEKPDEETMGIWYWYQIGSDTAATEIQAKLSQTLQKLSGRGDASIVIVSADCKNRTCNRVRESFIELSRYLVPRLHPTYITATKSAN